MTHCEMKRPWVQRGCEVEGLGEEEAPGVSVAQGQRRGTG